MMIVLALALAALTMAGLVYVGRLNDPEVQRRKSRRCTCQGCRAGAPDDGEPLNCWEWNEMDRIQAFYADTADEPAPERAWWWS